MTETDQLQREVKRLQSELFEAEETIRAIYEGRVDAFVVGAQERDRVYLLESIDSPFRVIVERMQQSAATVSTDGTILYANRQLSTLLDRPRERLVGRFFSDLLVEADRPLFDALTAGNADRPHGEMRLRRADGSTVPVYVSAGEMSRRNGVETCLLITDLTQQKQHEKLIAAETLARSMLEQAADAVVVCDTEDVIVLASPAARELCGRNPLRHRFGEMMSLVVAEESPLAHDGHFEPGRLDTVVRGLEVQLECDGGPRQLLLSASPVRDSQGASLGSVVTLADISALKRAEAELRASDRRKDEFLAMLGHELRNPLATIVSGVQILRRMGEVNAGSAVFDMMERQSEHLVRLVDDLLEISRIARGKIELRKEVLDFGRVLDDALQTSRANIDAKKHRFEVKLPDEPIRIECDGVRLTQVLANLLNNAAKYTPPGGSILLSASVEEDQLVVRVKDNGQGIDPDALEQVFDMFAQSRQSSPSQSGLGVGLALVKTLVVLHQGTVRAASDGVDSGSEFTIRLPLGAAAQTTD